MTDKLHQKIGFDRNIVVFAKPLDDYVGVSTSSFRSFENDLKEELGPTQYECFMSMVKRSTPSDGLLLSSCVVKPVCVTIYYDVRGKKNTTLELVDPPEITEMRWHQYYRDLTSAVTIYIEQVDDGPLYEMMSAESVVKIKRLCLVDTIILIEYNHEYYRYQLDGPQYQEAINEMVPLQSRWIPSKDFHFV